MEIDHAIILVKLLYMKSNNIGFTDQNSLRQSQCQHVTALKFPQHYEVVFYLSDGAAPVIPDSPN